MCEVTTLRYFFGLGFSFAIGCWPSVSKTSPGQMRPLPRMFRKLAAGPAVQGHGDVLRPASVSATGQGSTDRKCLRLSTLQAVSVPCCLFSQPLKNGTSHLSSQALPKQTVAH